MDHNLMGRSEAGKIAHRQVVRERFPDRVFPFLALNPSQLARSMFARAGRLHSVESTRRLADSTTCVPSRRLFVGQGVSSHGIIRDSLSTEHAVTIIESLM
jgi:hypothetical protein